MKRASVVTLMLASLVPAAVGCVTAQELQGTGSDGGSDSDGGIATGTDSGATSDSGVIPKGDSGIVGSSCIPATTSGSATILMNGDVSNFSFGNSGVPEVHIASGTVYALSGPWDFYTVPVNGGTAKLFEYDAYLPDYISMAAAPSSSVLSGSVTIKDLALVTLGSDTAIALRQPSGGYGSLPVGEVIVSGNFAYHWTYGPVNLVESSLSGGTERIMASFDDASHTNITAMAVDTNYVYYTTVTVPAGTSLPTDIAVMKVARSTGAPERVATLSGSGRADAIAFDTDNYYVSMASGSDRSTTVLRIPRVGTPTPSPVQLQTAGYELRTTKLVLDDTYVYWGAYQGSVTATPCTGQLMRAPKSYLKGQGLNSSITKILTGVDTPRSIDLAAGTVVLATSGQATATKKNPGQIVSWKP